MTLTPNFASFPPSALSLHFISLSISLLLSSIKSGAFTNAHENGIASYQIPVTGMEALVVKPTSNQRFIARTCGRFWTRRSRGRRRWRHFRSGRRGHMIRSTPMTAVIYQHCGGVKSCSQHSREREFALSIDIPSFSLSTQNGRWKMQYTVCPQKVSPQTFCTDKFKKARIEQN